MSEGKRKTRAIMFFGVAGLAIGALITASLTTTYWQISDRQNQLQIQADEFDRLELSERMCKQTIVERKETVEKLEETIEKEGADAPEELNGLNEDHDRCNFKLASAEASLNYLDTLTKRLRLKVLEKQRREEHSPPLRAALAYLVGEEVPDVGDMDDESARNNLIIHLDQLGIEAVERLQRMTNDEIVQIARPHFQVQVNPNFI